MSNRNNFVPEDDEAYERRLYEEQKAYAMRNTEEYKKAQRDAERKREEERRKQLAQDRVELMKLKSGVIEESETIKEEEKVERVLTTKEKIFTLNQLPAGAYLIKVSSKNAIKSAKIILK